MKRDEIKRKKKGFRLLLLFLAQLVKLIPLIFWDWWTDVDHLDSRSIDFAGPNTPGRFIVWFRNETTLLVLWQPPYPAGIYSNYKVNSP